MSDGDHFSLDNAESYSGKSFPVVAIGAAAGGVEAVKELLKNLPSKTGLAFIYIQYPEGVYDGKLKTALVEITKMPVLYAEPHLIIKPDHLYLLPLPQSLVVYNNKFIEEQKKEESYPRLPINRFFTSLSEQYEANTIGILLSGSITDGIIGLKAIKLAGGLAFTQNDSAQFKYLPKTALAEGAADLALSPKDMARELERIGNKKDVYLKAVNELNENLIDNNDENLLLLFKLLEAATGVDFSMYKMNTIKRRIIRRMMLYKIESVREYVQYLKVNSDEISYLYQDMLINVTSFFRDELTSEYLANEELPKLINSKVANDPIRIWIPACSTGQEAYSLAMLVVEQLGENSTNIPVQIFATDLSEVAITKARMGLYSKDEVLGVSPRRLQRFFTRQDGHYRIIKSLRDICVFAPQNIAKDPPFSRLDIISCCNLMIYLNVVLQKKLLATFHTCLNNNGILILGKSETVGSSSYLFSLIDKKARVYIKKKEARPQAQFDITYNATFTGKSYPFAKLTGPSKFKSDDAELDKVVDTLLLKRFTPASVVVNFDLDILLFRGATGLYLEPSPGKASLNLMKMAKLGLGFELKNMVYKSKKTGEPARKEGLEIIVDSKAKRVSIEAIPLKTDTLEGYYLIVFEEFKIAEEVKGSGPAKDSKVKHLEAELSALREDMRSIVESQEAVNEELQSANEEIVSSNEELQSINEELETSKEEIESSNEELITINQELQLRNEQLAEAQEYSEAIFTFMRESLLILDTDLRIKTANKAFYRTFQVEEEDTEGQLLYDLGNRQWNIAPLREVINDLVSHHTEFIGLEVAHHFPQIGEKVMLVNGRRIIQNQNNQHVILISIEDITAFRQGKK